MIIQLGALFSTALSGLAKIGSQAFQAVAPSLITSGSQFLQRELSRRLGREQIQRVKTQAIEVLNTPGISVARIGGTIQPVGGRVQRSTFTPAAISPAQSPIGNVPLLPVGFGAAGPGFSESMFGRIGFGAGGTMGLGFPAPMFGGRLGGAPRGSGLALPPGPQVPARIPMPGAAAPISSLALAGVRQPRSGPQFMSDERGNAVKFVPSPDGRGFLPVQQALQLGLKASKPHWRFNLATGMYEKMKGRRMNPFNFRAAARAGRRIDATLDAVKEFVRIEKKMKKGAVSFKKKKKKK